MRILIVHRKLPYPANSGGTLRGAYLANSLARRHDVALVSFADRSAQEPEPEIVARFHAFETVPLPEMPRPLTRWLSREPGDVQQLVSGEMRRKISRIVDSLRPDVIVAGDPSLTWHVAPYRECARILDYICVATLQFERLRDLATGPQRILWEMRRRKYGAFHRRIAEHYDLCLLNSREDEDALRESAPMWGRVAVVPNGLDLNAYPTDLAPVERNMLVYPGSVGT